MTHDEELLDNWNDSLAGTEPEDDPAFMVERSDVLTLIERVRADERDQSRRHLGSTLNVTYMALVDQIKPGSSDGPMTEQQAAMRDGAHLMFKAIHERLAADLLRSQGPVVLTLEELDALPVGSVVLDDMNFAWQLGGGGLWWITASGYGIPPTELMEISPVRLLYRAGDGR